MIDHTVALFDGVEGDDDANDENDDDGEGDSEDDDKVLVNILDPSIRVATNILQ